MREDTSANQACPGCYSAGASVFYRLDNVPVHSVLLMPTREAALNYPKGDIRLGFCRVCGLISNLAFDPRLHEYSPRYEETQGFSASFRAFHQDLATHLIDRYDLHNKDIIEIGCGKGEFLTTLCQLGGNRGIGFDPAYVRERHPGGEDARVRFIQDLYSEKYAHYQGDLICCKMTLEHIHQPRDFVSTIRRSIGERRDTVVFFQVPDVRRILRELAFWDIYYEHCSYFSAGSLARLFRTCGFDPIDLWTDYGGQYLMIEARPGGGQPGPGAVGEERPEELARDVAYFAENHQQKLDSWGRRLQELNRCGRRAVLWGGGSKAVALLTTLGIRCEIQYVVDINPYRQRTFVAGSGQQIVAPDFLREYRPDVVIVMNPIYQEEIEQDLTRMGLAPEIFTV